MGNLNYGTEIKTNCFQHDNTNKVEYHKEIVGYGIVQIDYAGQVIAEPECQYHTRFRAEDVKIERFGNRADYRVDEFRHIDTISEDMMNTRIRTNIKMDILDLTNEYPEDQVHEMSNRQLLETIIELKGRRITRKILFEKTSPN